MPDWFQPWPEYEAEAEMLRAYQSTYVPGLLQTEAYARAVLAELAALQERVEQETALRRELLNFIKREDFMKFLGSNVEACMHTAQQLSEKYHSAQREIRSLGLSQTTSEKLARLLLDWSEKTGEPTTKGIRIKVLLTHEEIAQMIGTTRETVTRLLSDFKRRKMIDVKGSSLFILNKPTLENLVSV